VIRVLISILLFVGLTAAAPRQPDWTRTVTTTAAGAYVLGKPDAKVRLVEYLSYTCPHCAHFTAEAAAPLTRDYIAKGLVSYEIRNAVRDHFDFVAALLARCGGPAKFFGNTEVIMAAQPLMKRRMASVSRNCL
jgi:protein-disulfide isomerase